MEALFLYEKFLFSAAQEILYGRTDMPRLLIQLGERMQCEFGTVLCRIGRRMTKEKGELLETVWQEEMAQWIGTVHLKTKEKELFFLFPGEICHIDSMQQKAALERLGNLAGEYSLQIRKKQTQNEKMTMALCIWRDCGGDSVCITRKGWEYGWESV